MKEIEAIRTALAAGPTQGEWRVGALGSRAIYDHDGWVIGNCSNYKTPVESALNANYIAACNPAAMQKIIEHIDAQQSEIERLREALKFYAEGDHFIFDRDEWDTVSGEPQNFWCDEAGTATVEDGTIAKLMLAAMKETP